MFQVESHVVHDILGRPFKESGKRLDGRGESRHQLREWGQTLAGKAPGLGLGLECADK